MASVIMPDTDLICSVLHTTHFYIGKNADNISFVLLCIPTHVFNLKSLIITLFRAQNVTFFMSSLV